jgi:hypothetical protein
MLTSDGRRMGRKERLRGQMGVRVRVERVGEMREPPAEREYAVEPVGVETMRLGGGGGQEGKASKRGDVGRGGKGGVEGGEGGGGGPVCEAFC